MVEWWNGKRVVVPEVDVRQRTGNVLGAAGWVG